MSDLISRQAAIEADDFFLVDPGDGWNDIANERNRVLEYVSDKIMHIPPAPRWIPVTERLPKDSKSVLVWCPYFKNSYCAYRKNDIWWIFGAYRTELQENVIAWMPLPEPYKEENNEQIQG